MELRGVGMIAPRIEGAEAARPGGGGERSTADGADFGSVLRRSLTEVNKLQGEADAAVEALVTGKGVSLHDTMIALEKADLSFRLMMQVRNKIVQAYREIVTMQV
jgi:flagellar hook-basal body complex protein FliE